MRITIVIDSPNSWIVPYGKALKKMLSQKNQVNITAEHNEIEEGDCAVYLSCEKIIKPEVLKLNKHNLVVHESRLPEGRGLSPLTWQILEGKNEVYITLFEVAEKIDNGDIYLQDIINFRGDELIDELRQQQGKKTIELILKYINGCNEIKGRKQVGKPSYYSRRMQKDSELDINKTIESQFNLLRVVDNKRYPAFFNHKGCKYILKIYKEKK